MKKGKADGILSKLLLGFLGALAGSFTGLWLGIVLSKLFSPGSGVRLNDFGFGVLCSFLGGIAGVVGGFLLAGSMASGRTRPPRK